MDHESLAESEVSVSAAPNRALAVIEWRKIKTEFKRRGRKMEKRYDRTRNKTY